MNILKVIAFFIKKHYKKVSAEKKLKIKCYGPLGESIIGTGDFLLALVTIDAIVLQNMPAVKKNSIPLLSCQYFDLTSDALINYIANIDDEDEGVKGRFFNAERIRSAYYNSLTIVWSWLDYKFGLRWIGSYVNHSFAWEKCFLPGARTKWDFYTPNLRWYAVARNIRIFKGDMKAGLVPNIPEVKQFLNDRIPPPLDLKKKDKYMRMMGFRPLPVPFTDCEEEGKLQRKLNYYFIHILKTYLERHGPLHLQCTAQDYTAILDVDSSQQKVKIDGQSKMGFPGFYRDWLYYPEFLTPALSKAIAKHNREAYWYSLQRFFLEPFTDPLARRKRSLPIPKTYKSKTPEPYFYSPIYYFKGNKP